MSVLRRFTEIAIPQVLDGKLNMETKRHERCALIVQEARQACGILHSVWIRIRTCQRITRSSRKLQRLTNLRFAAGEQEVG